ncbi:MAG: bifunctional diguanylate cyclase/phosphodiesterase [Bacteroidales bacterium]|nr:bifunctional diguanylate cyclase/phosphodiesterase [Lachnoclostridium sp.]MCM1384145.1 bifunctional diguanylate cyclase/phosphodiesterase [Lachnoclostridium sp.]MCM1464811.1 bifunctional diguanylate cyclase/phosphodiesterase [Bacteroidales bacterium]
MRITMTVFLVLLLAINSIMIFRLGDMKRTDVIVHLRSMALGVAGIIVPEIIILLTKDRQIAYYAFTFYYIAFAWYAMMIFRFSVNYSGYRLFKIYKSPLFWITVIESAALIWGMFSERFFTIAHAKWYNHIFWIARGFSMLYVYAVVSGITLVGAVVVLMIAASQSARLYRLRYSGVAIVFAVMAVSCVTSHIGHQPILVHVICFALCEIVIVYMAVHYAPRKLNQRVMRFVADKLNDGVVLYDDEHQLQFVTAGYSDAVGLKGMQGIDNEEMYWSKVISEANVENAWNGRVMSVAREDGTYYYEIQHMALDEEGKLIGIVYWIRNVTESIKNYREMVHRANFDELTGIYNEAHFHEKARRLLEEHPDTDFVMICSSVEKFRVFKELFGEEKYDDYLIRTAQALRTGLVEIPNCVYGRIGESDFYIMMPKEVFDPQQFLDAIDRVAKSYSTNNFNLIVKAGVYEITEPSQEMLAICNKASMACDTIKGDYGTRIMWFDESVRRESMLRERYNAELSKAIEHGEIQIYLQPQVDKEGKVIGAEALARWIHREDGLIPPAHFIPFFEMNGRITELDICIWRQACEKLKEWKEKGRDDLHISVNISARDLYALDIYEHYVSLVKEYGIAPKNLKLEITESAIINDLKQHVHLVERLQEAGFEVEMDDFGSAYSSFNMLKDICVDVLKIDMKFLGDTQNEERSHAILRSIVDLSGELHMKTIAEGVETEEQLAFLKGVGCDIYQGYYFSRPMSVADFEARYL